jgi:tRNA threonylcarbamoyladenosine biosynthesis protein TsaE
MEQESNKITTLTVTSKSAADTEVFGAAIGAQLKGGEVLALASDLGGGKTTFTRGLVRGSGSKDHVASPTFTVSKVYKVETANKKFEIHHFDFYRLQEAGIMRNEFAELVGDPAVVIVVEWSDIVADVLPKDRLMVSIRSVGDSEEKRQITIEAPASLGYLLQGLQGVAS